MTTGLKSIQKKAINRFDELRSSIDDYERIKHTIKTGLEDREKISQQKQRSWKGWVLQRNSGMTTDGS